MKLYLIPLLIISIFLSLVFGEVVIPLNYLINPPGVYRIIVFDIRIPTVISTALIGATLAVSGAILQSLLRNPLLDPYISGTSSGGAFGAVLSYFLLAFNLPFSQIIYISPLVAFLFALLATLLTISIGRRGITSMVVGGVVISYIFSSLLTIMITLLETRFPQIPPLTFWLLGEITITNWSFVLLLIILSSLMIYFALINSRKIDLVSISDEMSYSKGINPNLFRMLWITIISIVVSLIVSETGIIGFIGIIVPHIVRKISSGSSSDLIPNSSLLGSSVMLLSNVVSNGVFGFKIPVTVITSLLASPIIILILVRGFDAEGGQR